MDAVVARHSFSSFGNTFVLFPDRLGEVFSVFYEKFYLVIYYINQCEKQFLHSLRKKWRLGSSLHRSQQDLSIHIQFSLNPFICEENTIVLCIRGLLYSIFLNIPKTKVYWSAFLSTYFIIKQHIQSRSSAWCIIQLGPA
jgi:hypothetical protein